MNILVLTPLVPYPPHDGDKLRLYYFLRHLKKKGHTIDLFCLTRVKEDLVPAPELKALCRNLYIEHISNWDLFFNLISALLVGSSFNVMSHFSPKFRDRLEAYFLTPQGRSVGVLFAHRLRMAPYVFRYSMVFKTAGKKFKYNYSEEVAEKPAVLDLTDCLTAYTKQLSRQNGAPWLRRLAANYDHWFLKREEVALSAHMAKVTIISPLDADILVTNGLAEDQIEVVPNGVDLSKKISFKNPYPSKRPVVCFVGNMGYAPNEEGALWFLRSVWPLVKAKVPNALFAAVGGSPRRGLRRFHNGKDVWVTGYVKEVEPYLLNAQVSVAPLRFAGGMQNKVAQSMGYGVPVVATTASTGWLPEAGKVLVRIADNHEVFAREVVAALKKPASSRARALKAKGFISKNYSWEKAGQKFEAILKRAGGTR